MLIYQMGKVGSTSLSLSLKQELSDRPIFHIHYLTESLINSIAVHNRTEFRPDMVKRCRNNWDSMLVREKLNAGLGDKKLKVITMVRDPVARNISAFFQTLQIDHDTERSCYHLRSFYGFETTATDDDVSTLGPFFLSHFEHDTPLVFFDRELKGVLDVDVFATRFPKEKGYAILESDRAEVLVLRLEDLDQCVQEAIREFLGLEHFELGKFNVGKSKGYGGMYRTFLKTMALPASYLDQMYESRYARHFYTDHELAKFRDRWHLASNDVDTRPITVASQ